MSIYTSWKPDDLPPKMYKLYAVEPTGDFGYDTLRTKFKVTCLRTNTVIHPNTTGPNSYIAYHEKEVHGSSEMLLRERLKFDMDKAEIEKFIQNVQENASWFSNEGGADGTLAHDEWLEKYRQYKPYITDFARECET